MAYVTERRIVIITRQTREDALIRRFNNVAQASFYVSKMGGRFEEYAEEATTYRGSVADSLGRTQELGRVQTIDRAYVPGFIFGEDDIVVAIGQDGLVANTLKYLDGQPLIGINPDPARYDGALLPFRAQDLARVVRDVIRNQRPYQEITMAAVELNDGQSLLAVNDFFVGASSHVSARYRIGMGGIEEAQCSSGVIVSTGLGATGWLKSVIAGARAVAAAITGRECVAAGELGRLVGDSLRTPRWDSGHLYYSVREPFPSVTTGVSFVFGVIQDAPLCIASEMSENGVIFSDGVEEDFLQFNAGIEARISVSPKKGYLVV